MMPTPVRVAFQQAPLNRPGPRQRGSSAPWPFSSPGAALSTLEEESAEGPTTTEISAAKGQAS